MLWFWLILHELSQLGSSAGKLYNEYNFISTYLPTYLPTYLSIYLPIYISIPYAYLFIFIYLSIHPSIHRYPKQNLELDEAKG